MLRTYLPFVLLLNASLAFSQTDQSMQMPEVTVTDQALQPRFDVLEYQV